MKKELEQHLSLLEERESFLRQELRESDLAAEKKLLECELKQLKMRYQTLGREFSQSYRKNKDENLLS